MNKERDWKGEDLKRYLDQQLMVQQKAEEKIKTIRKILTMRDMNKNSISQMATEFGKSKQYISFLIKQLKI